MTRHELLAALLAERQDCRWFPTPEKSPHDLGIRPDDDVTTARRRRALLDDDMASGRWVQRRGVKVWVAA